MISGEIVVEREFDTVSVNFNLENIGKTKLDHGSVAQCMIGLCFELTRYATNNNTLYL
jgi:hypothetical protein